jgi:hypothetical protein
VDILLKYALRDVLSLSSLLTPQGGVLFEQEWLSKTKPQEKCQPEKQDQSYFKRIN